MPKIEIDQTESRLFAETRFGSTFSAASGWLRIEARFNSRDISASDLAFVEDLVGQVNEHMKARVEAERNKTDTFLSSTLDEMVKAADPIPKPAPKPVPTS